MQKSNFTLKDVLDCQEYILESLKRHNCIRDFRIQHEDKISKSREFQYKIDIYIQKEKNTEMLKLSFVVEED